MRDTDHRNCDAVDDPVIDNARAIANAPARTQPGEILCILGMHRSGTSCLTGSLQEADLFLGKHHTRNRYNQKGNRENQDIVDLHDEVLAGNGGHWDRPPRRCHWSEAQLERLRALLYEYRDCERFGFKDPRTLLTLTGWTAVADNLRFVGIFRHPSAVAGSLNSRDSMPRAQAVELWYQYNLRLLRQYLRKPFPLLCFDDDESELKIKIAAVAQELGLTHVANGNGFYSSNLRHHEASDAESLPAKARLLYRALKWVSR